MRKFKTFLMPALALLISASCKENEVASPSSSDITSVFRSSCISPSQLIDLAAAPIDIELSTYLNCVIDDGAECLYRMLQTASYGSVDIYPNIISNTSNAWPGTNWGEVITLSQQVAQTGLSSVAWPTGATSIKIDRYEIIDDWVSAFNPNPYNPWIYKVNVKVYYEFCGVSGPGGDSAPSSNSDKWKLS